MGPLVLLEFGPIANCMGQLGPMGVVFCGAPGTLFAEHKLSLRFQIQTAGLKKSCRRMSGTGVGQRFKSYFKVPPTHYCSQSAAFAKEICPSPVLSTSL